MENNSVASVKDPSITNLCNLSKTSHIVEAVNKANNVLGLIKHTVGSAEKNIFFTSYMSLVRQILENASHVSSLFLVKDIAHIEKVQKRTSQLALGQRRGKMPYQDHCEALHWSSLSNRRLYLSLI